MTRFFPEDKDFKSALRFPDEDYEDDPMSYERPSDPLPVKDTVSKKRARMMSLLRQPDPPKPVAPPHMPRELAPKAVDTTPSGKPAPEPQPIPQFWEDGPDEFSFDYSRCDRVVPRAHVDADLSKLSHEKTAIQLADGTTLVKVGKIMAVCPKP